MQLEILRGPASYLPENLYGPKTDRGAPAHRLDSRPPVKPSAAEGAIPESRGHCSDIFSTKHERLLLRAEHIARMDSIRRAFNKSRVHAGQRALTTSDLVNACLDFVFEQRIPFHDLGEADDLKALISDNVYRTTISKWRQYNEVF